MVRNRNGKEKQSFQSHEKYGFNVMSSKLFFPEGNESHFDTQPVLEQQESESRH